MLLLVALAAAVNAPPPVERAAAAPHRQATATVRILSSAPVRFADIERHNPRALRRTEVRAPDGAVRTAKLLEFE